MHVNFQNGQHSSAASTEIIEVGIRLVCIAMRSDPSPFGECMRRSGRKLYPLSPPREREEGQAGEYFASKLIYGFKGRGRKIGGLQLELHGHEICVLILKAENCSAIVMMYTKSQTAHHASLSAISGLLPILELLLQILDLLLVFKMVEHSRCLNATRTEDTFRCAQDTKPTIQPICKWKYIVFSIRVDIRRRGSSCYKEIRLNTNYRNI